MLNYSLNYSNKDGYVQIVKDYVLQIKRLKQKILITKEKKNFGFRNESFLDFPYPLFGCIKADDVYTQLANIKHIGFEVTDACNLKCTYCIYGDFYSNYDERNCKQIDSRKAKLLIDFLVDKLNSPANNSQENEILISFYGGEPLLNIDFIKEIVGYTQKMKDKHIIFNYVMTTNAIYLRKYIDFLIRYDFDITISLDGSKENNAYRKFHNGNSSFDIVYKNVKYVQVEYPDYFTRKIKFNTVLHNLNNIPEVFSFFQHEFGKVSRFSEVNPAGVKYELKKEFEELISEKPYVENEEIDAEMKRILDLDFGPQKLLQYFIFHYSGNTYDDYNMLLVKKEKINHLPTATCIPFSKRIFMTVNNKIFPCEKIGHQYSLGEVTNDGVNIDCEYIAKKYNEYYDSLRRQCSSCFLQKSCSQCVFDIQNLDKNPVCNKMGNRQMLQEYLRRNMKILHDNPELYRRIMNEIIIMK